MKPAQAIFFEDVHAHRAMRLRVILLMALTIAALFTKSVHADPLPGDAQLEATANPWAYGTARELAFNYNTAQIKATAAYARGYTGAGQMVAVFDTGINLSPEFSGRLVATQYDAYTGRTEALQDNQYHGTFVAGIIGAARDGVGTVGIAYDTRMMSIQIANSTGGITLSDLQLSRAISYASNARAKIFNNSWNSSTAITSLSRTYLASAMAYTLNAYRSAVSTGAIVVFAAGNDGSAQPGFYASLPYYFPELQKGWVAAVATDQTGSIASYSNRCGVAAAYCLAAPGTNITSVYLNGYGTGSGTSFAAPAVSGAIAVLSQEYPYLTNEQILSILFRTANKSGIYSNSAIYGQGLLDLDKATQPVGTTTVAAKSGVVSASSTLISSNAIFGNAMTRSLGAQPLLIEDEYGRGYLVSASSIVSSGASAFDAGSALAQFGGRNETTLDENGTVVAYAFDGANKSDDNIDGPDHFLVSRELDGLKVAAAYHMNPVWALSAQDYVALQPASFIAPDAAGIPYLALAHDSSTIAYGMPTRLGLFTVATFEGKTASAPVQSYANILPYDRTDYAPVFGAASSLTMKLSDAAHVNFDSGAVIEDGTLLGATYSGAAQLGGKTTTAFLGGRGVYALPAGLSLFGGADIGITRATASSTSLITDISDLVTTTFNAGLTKATLFGAHDRASFIVSQPIRVESGAAHLTLPTGMDANGNALYSDVSTGLGADGRELDLQALYATPLGARSSLNLGAMLQSDPGNTSGGEANAVFLSRYRFVF